MKGILPESVRTRPDKVAFSTPEDQWFRNELQDMVWSVISSSSFKNRPYFDQKNVKDEFKAHCQGKKNLSTAIWRWVNLELWLRRFINE
jgi:asparagine synthase (glutamine-hydrolysing)